MKRHSKHLGGLIAALIVAIVVAEAHAQVSLTEITAWTTGPDIAYVELTNVTNDVVNLGDWRLTNVAPDTSGFAASGRRFSNPTFLSPHESVIVSDLVGPFQERFERYPDYLANLDQPLFGTWTLHGLISDASPLEFPRHDGQLFLVDGGGRVVDAISWNPTMSLVDQVEPSVEIGRDLVGHRVDPTKALPNAEWRVDLQYNPGTVVPFDCPAQSICGDGIRSEEEACDDGNSESGDGCSDLCATEPGYICDSPENACTRGPFAMTACVAQTEFEPGSLFISEVAFSSSRNSCQGYIELTSRLDHEASLSTVYLSDGEASASFDRNAFIGPTESIIIATQFAPMPDLSAGFGWSCRELLEGWSLAAEFGPIDANVQIFELFDSVADIPQAWRSVDHASLPPLVAYPGEVVRLSVADSGADEDRRTIAGVQWGDPSTGQDTPLPEPIWRGRVLPSLSELAPFIGGSPVTYALRKGGRNEIARDWRVSTCPSPGVIEEAPPAVGPANYSRRFIANGAARTISLPETTETSSVLLVENSNSLLIDPLYEGSPLFKVSDKGRAGEVALLRYWVTEGCLIDGPFEFQVSLHDSVDCFADRDRDGFGALGVSPILRAGTCQPVESEIEGDCDDGDDRIKPGAIESCDGRDNDCDTASSDGADEPDIGQTCDGLDSDLCETGLKVCNGVALVCLETSFPKVEICDGVDNDCNPATADGADELFLGSPCDGEDGDLCVNGAVACQNADLQCVEAQQENSEICDGVDNDCNPLTPDGFGELGFNASCVEGLGACTAFGKNECVGGKFECSAREFSPSSTVDTVCDGIDEDCDGEVDEDVVGNVVTCGVGACQRDGLNRCVDGEERIECEPGNPMDESRDNQNCDDGIDNDCDSSIDGDIECGELIPCFTDEDGDGEAGSEFPVTDDLACMAVDGFPFSTDCDDDPASDCAGVSFEGNTELCDGCDNDCDGEADEEFAELGQPCSIPSRPGRPHCEARWKCTDGALVGGCEPIDPDAIACGITIPGEGDATDGSEVDSRDAEIEDAGDGSEDATEVDDADELSSVDPASTAWVSGGGCSSAPMREHLPGIVGGVFCLLAFVGNRRRHKD